MHFVTFVQESLKVLRFPFARFAKIFIFFLRRSRYKPSVNKWNRLSVIKLCAESFREMRFFLHRLRAVFVRRPDHSRHLSHKTRRKNRRTEWHFFLFYYFHCKAAELNVISTQFGTGKQILVNGICIKQDEKCPEKGIKMNKSYLWQTETRIHSQHSIVSFEYKIIWPWFMFSEPRRIKVKGDNLIHPDALHGRRRSTLSHSEQRRSVSLSRIMIAAEQEGMEPSTKCRLHDIIPWVNNV